MMDIIRIDTNSQGANSKGHFLGLEGNAFLPLVIAIFVSVMIFVAILMSGGSGTTAFVSGLIPTGIVAPVLFFLKGKPPHYPTDCIEQIVFGKSYNMESPRHIQHPRDKARKGVK